MQSPYHPGTGARPDVLVGRDAVFSQAQALVERVRSTGRGWLQQHCGEREWTEQRWWIRVQSNPCECWERCAVRRDVPSVHQVCSGHEPIL